MSGRRRSYEEDLSDSGSQAALHQASGLEWNKTGVLEEMAEGDEAT